MISNYQNLATITRAGSVESVHFGFWAFFDGKNFSGFGLNEKICLRSVAKPFQALTALELGLELSSVELAICAASHSGTEDHLKVIHNLLNKFEIKYEQLKCGIHEPFKHNIPVIEPQILQNNCSGKHLMMLATCQKMGWSLEDYFTNEHPLQQAVLQKLCELCECAAAEIEIGLDGCGLPTYGIKTKDLLIGFNKLRLSSPDINIQKLVQSYLSHSFYVSGENRLDNELTKAFNSEIICKSGAGGITVVSLQKGGSLLIKMADANEKIRAILLKKLLQEQGLQFHSANPLFSEEILNLNSNLAAQLQIFLQI